MDFFSASPLRDFKMFPYLLLFLCLLQVITSVRLALYIYRNRHFPKEIYQAILSFLSATEKTGRDIIHQLGYAPSAFIYINSLPGVGKHTIAKELVSQLDGPARVIQNQLHIDLAGALLPRSSPDHQHLRQQLREVLFTTLATNQDTFQYTYIFTDFQSANALGARAARQHLHAARARGSIFIPIVLACEAVEDIHRTESRERADLAAQGQKGTWPDTHYSSEKARRRGEIFRFGCDEELELDVTELSVEEVAKRITAHVEAVMSWG